MISKNKTVNFYYTFIIFRAFDIYFFLLIISPVMQSRELELLLLVWPVKTESEGMPPRSHGLTA